MLGYSIQERKEVKKRMFNNNHHTLAEGLLRKAPVKTRETTTRIKQKNQKRERRKMIAESCITLQEVSGKSRIYND